VLLLALTLRHRDAIPNPHYITTDRGLAQIGATFDGMSSNRMTRLSFWGTQSASLDLFCQDSTG